jgi:hypothetical protein
MAELTPLAAAQAYRRRGWSVIAVRPRAHLACRDDELAERMAGSSKGFLAQNAWDRKTSP